MFENKDDPGTDAEPDYDIIEEGDEEYDKLEVTAKNTAKPQSPDTVTADASSEQKKVAETSVKSDKPE